MLSKQQVRQCVFVLIKHTYIYPISTDYIKVWDKTEYSPCCFLHCVSRRSCFYLSVLLCFSVSVARSKVWREFFIRIVWWWLASDEKQFPLCKYPSSLMLSDSKCDIQGIQVTLWVTDNVICFPKINEMNLCICSHQMYVS